MNTVSHSLALAIDGGGSRCRFAAITPAGRTVVETGPANVATDFDGALHEILRGLHALADASGTALGDLHAAPAYLGLAGVVSEEIADRLRAALPFAAARIEDDRPAALRGALGPKDGVISHCGTGSFFAGQSGNEIRLSGGWGAALGDEASAQWVGRRALSTALKTEDGRLPPSPLSRQLLADFEGPAGIVFFARDASPAQLGALAPRVTLNASQGDPLALRIMEEGAAEIASALASLGWKPGQPICLTGGIGPYFAPYLPEALRRYVAQPVGEPLDGAVALARQFAEECAHAAG